MFSVHTKTKRLGVSFKFGTVDLTVEIKLRFQIPPVQKSVFEKLRFRDGLVWTVGLTVEIELYFQIPPV